jgi:serine/threonine-protein kinase
MAIRFSDGGLIMWVLINLAGTKSNKSLEEAVTISKRICEALEKAHRKDIIHRDIKPSNILFDKAGYVYLGDFGIVKKTEATRTTQMIGTPEYMASEPIEDQPVDRRTDVYQMDANTRGAISGVMDTVIREKPA